MPTVNPKRWWALAVLATAQFMMITDTSITGVALPETQKDPGFSQGGLRWVFNTYVIAFGGLLLLGGRWAGACPTCSVHAACSPPAGAC